MAAVGEPFLSSVFRGALQKLDSPILRKFKSLAGIDKDLRKLNRTLSKIQFVLNDAEAKQISNWAVKDLIDELKDLAFDVDDVLDEVATEAFRFNQKKKVTSSESQSESYFPLVHKIEDINGKLDEIAKEGDELGLKGGVQVASTELRDSKRLSSSLIDESEVFGRDDDKKKIIKLLHTSKLSTNWKGHCEEMQSFAFGGTDTWRTLARKNYNLWLGVDFGK
ncbi:hypothetical protein P3X46_001771 [Hevea brasiliensis]|uniref:Disease resistance N-terminal domain-containing protein n=1 Tax=Hevea brasiliensis TaxID=3981 RepID=A0ABQ9NI58_HEVBR|nr:hypothetical protein P3X46_001771 [Hevea brasiliensis]